MICGNICICAWVLVSFQGRRTENREHGGRDFHHVFLDSFHLLDAKAFT